MEDDHGIHKLQKALHSPPRKVALKKSKSCAKFVSEVAQKKSEKLRAILHILSM